MRAWALATFALLVVAGLIVLATFRDYGNTWDERLQQELGRDVVSWFASLGRDTRALSGGSIGNLHLYGGMFEATAEVAARVLPFDPVETRHLVNALVALAGAVGTALLARRLGGSRAGFLGAALLLATPPWWGHGFANSKDVPFAAAYPWLLLALLRASDELPRPPFRRLAAAGAALGAGLALRPGGIVVLLPLSAGIFAVRLVPLVRAAAAVRPRVLAAASGRLGAIVGLGWLGMLAFWPYGLCNPISGPLAAFAAARSFRWDGLVRFAGSWVRSTDLPRSYAPTWFLATLPESWFAIAAAAVAGGVIAWRLGRLRLSLERAWLDRALVGAAGFGPIAAAVVIRPVLYDGVRHLLFVLPALAALGGWALSGALDQLPRWGGRATLALVGGLAVLAVVDAVRLHPYQYLYFNRLVAGGLERASRDYELDYWGATGREAMAWVARNVVPPRGRGSLSVTTTADASVASHWIEGDAVLPSRFVFDAHAPPDLTLATTRWFEHRATGRVLHVVERMGVPLLYVIDSTPGSGGPIVLEGGDLAVALPPAPAWTGRAVISPGDERAAYLFRRVIGVPAQVEAWVLTPRSGAVPDVDELRGKVAGIAATVLDGRAGAIEPQPVVGPDARGWVVTNEREPSAGLPRAAVAAIRVGGAAVLVVAQYGGDTAHRELVEWIRAASLAKEQDRRRP